MPQGVTSANLAEFQQLLIGTWQNVDELTRDGKPLSYNVMPLPQDASQPGRPAEPGASEYGGFILKNFTFTETIRFNGTASAGDPKGQQDPGALAVAASAPNRGGDYTQAAHALFYEQQVHFAEGPDRGQIIHVENGAWLHLGSQAQNTGPYTENPAEPGVPLPPQPPSMNIAKQISVPHGNSILALGSVDLNDQGKFVSEPSGITANTVFERELTIPDAQVPLPQPTEVSIPPFYNPYSATLTGAGDFENPDVSSALNPNYPLQLALEKIKPRAYIHWRVTTEPLFGGSGIVTNIPFEQRRSDVTQYTADYWLLSKDRHAKESRQFDYLLYTQLILLKTRISTDNGESTKEYVFPHVTSNTVKKVGGTPTQARDATPSPLG